MAKCAYQKLNPKTTLFLLCDIQEKFRSVMKHFDPLVMNSKKLIEGGKILGVPLIVTEQYPERLGNTVKDIEISHAVGVFPKTKFSMCITPVFEKINQIYKNDLKDVVICGLESHVCVEQTSIDLLEKGYRVHICADAVMSRLLQDRDLALRRLQNIGCILQSTESVLFSLMQDKNHPQFKGVSKLVGEPSCEVYLSPAKL